MKKISLVLITLILAVGLVGCGSGGGDDASSTRTLKLAHNLSEDYPVHKSLVKMAEILEEKTNGELKVQIFPNGVLGSEKEVVEQLQNGAVDMTKVSAAALENFNDIYSVFSVPYLFKNQEHYYKAMDSDEVKSIYPTTKGEGFRALTWFDGGARSFYTVDQPILSPKDLEGLKLRVMSSQTSIKMVKLLGGTPTPMPYSDIYTGLQQGVVDGAENNATSLVNAKHGEVAKEYSLDEHTRIPDILVISTKTWNSLSDSHKKAFKEAAAEATEYHKGIWNDFIDECMAEAKEMGVTIHRPDKAPFREAVKPLLDEYKEDPKKREIIEAIEAIQ